MNRRDLMKVGTGYLGLNLGGLLRAAEASPPAANGPVKACILVFYYGGPSHIDSFDPKPAAPAEVRGDFKPIATSVPGVRVCEHLPRLSRVMHQCAIIRSVTHAARLHDSASIHALTGRPLEGPDRELFAPQPQFYPSYGSAVAHFHRDRPAEVPFAMLPFAFRNVVEVPCQGAGFLGSAFDPLRIEADAPTRAYQIDQLRPAVGIDAPRLGGRRSLLETLEKVPDAARKGLYAKAYRLLESDTVRRAADLSREPLAVRERYGIDAGNDERMRMRGQNLLLARRLVEAGVPFVNVHDFRQQGQNWDAHVNCTQQHKDTLLPAVDRSLSALIEDLDARGLLETTLVVAMGEFGRTPKINAGAGRDHWPDCYSVLMAGGGVSGGAVYGSSDRLGAYPATDPVTPGDLAATIFWRFGIDPAAEIIDTTNRPHRLAAGDPIRKLFTSPA